MGLTVVTSLPRAPPNLTMAQDLLPVPGAHQTLSQWCHHRAGLQLLTALLCLSMGLPDWVHPWTHIPGCLWSVPICKQVPKPWALKEKIKCGQWDLNKYLNNNNNNILKADLFLHVNQRRTWLKNESSKERAETDRICHVNKRNADSGRKRFQKTRCWI